MSMNEYGFQIDDSTGGIADNQMTLGKQGDPNGELRYDAARDLDYRLIKGQKVYLSPVGNDGTKIVYKQSKNGPPISDTGGGMVHGNPKWNPQTGKWDVNLDMTKILSWAAAAGIGAGAVQAAMAGGGAVPGSASAATSAAGPGSAIGPVLGATDASLAGAASTAAPLASTAVGTSAGITGAVGPTLGAETAAAGGTSVWSKLKGMINPQTAADVGSMFGDLAQTSATNRGNELSASQYQDQIATNRGAEDRASMSDAWKHMLQADYVKNRSTGYSSPTVLPTLPGGTPNKLPDFGFGPKASTPNQVAGATGMNTEVMKRLQNGSQLPPLTNASGPGSLAHPGGWEQLFNLVSSGSSLAGLFGSRR